MKILATSDDAGRALLAVSGEIDLQYADELRDSGLENIGDSGLAIDLSEVTFLDSSGLSALIDINNAVVEQGLGALTLAAPSRSVRKILELTGLLPVFTVID